MTEDQAILKHLRRSTITPSTAYTRYRCLALHSAIARLRKLGYRINCTMRAAGTKRWGVYKLQRGIHG